MSVLNNDKQSLALELCRLGFERDKLIDLKASIKKEIETFKDQIREYKREDERLLTASVVAQLARNQYFAATSSRCDPVRLEYSSLDPTRVQLLPHLPQEENLRADDLPSDFSPRFEIMEDDLPDSKKMEFFMGDAITEDSLRQEIQISKQNNQNMVETEINPLKQEYMQQKWKANMMEGRARLVREEIGRLAQVSNAYRQAHSDFVFGTPKGTGQERIEDGSERASVPGRTKKVWDKISAWASGK